MRRRRMGALPLADQVINLQTGNGAVVEEIKGLLRVYNGGHVERLPVVPEVSSAHNPQPDVTSKDVFINHSSGVWARFYVPKRPGQLPLLVYFHGGGFCVGSAAWSCYHEFLARLASIAGCIIMSVNYRLAPEHRLPAAYKDGLDAIKWVRQAADNSGSTELDWWQTKCNFARVFLSGDSAGAAIAHHVAKQLGLAGSSEAALLKPGSLRGVILIQPFFGGEARTSSERSLVQPPGSALSLETSDCYWRLALPAGYNRDHPWCNPLSKGSPKLEPLRLPPVMVCISETDILKDRNLEFCSAMRKAGKSVEHAVYGGVGHAFQILHNSHLSQARSHEMLTHIKAFISNR